MRMHPLALAESGWVWVGAGSRPAGLRTGRAIPGLRRDAALPVRQKTRQGREGGALPKPSSDAVVPYFVGISVKDAECCMVAGNNRGVDVPYASDLSSL